MIDPWNQPAQIKLLNPGEHVIAAWAEPASEPGWARPVWALVRNLNGELRTVCLQPNEQTEEILTLYRISVAVHFGMTSAVRRLLDRG